MSIIVWWRWKFKLNEGKREPNTFAYKFVFIALNKGILRYGRQFFPSNSSFFPYLICSARSHYRYNLFICVWNLLRLINIHSFIQRWHANWNEHDRIISMECATTKKSESYVNAFMLTPLNSIFFALLCFSFPFSQLQFWPDLRLLLVSVSVSVWVLVWITCHSHHFKFHLYLGFHCICVRMYFIFHSHFLLHTLHRLRSIFPSWFCLSPIFILFSEKIVQ